jgi:hypothetical protein
MKTIVSLSQQIHQAKLAGFMPTYWSMVNCGSNDRTPEITGVQGGQES